MLISIINFIKKNVYRNVISGASVVSDWILALGKWNDNGKWYDNAKWKD